MITRKSPGSAESRATSTTPIDVAHLTARRLDQRIRVLVGSISDNLTKLHVLVEEAKQGEIHKVLGFPSWTAYLADALTIQVQLGREQRRELVGYLSGEGMPQRAIATVVGTSVGTVNNDLDSGVQNRTPEHQDGIENQEVADCLAMAEMTDNDFESVLNDAREQGDHSRENVSQLCREKAPEAQVVGRDGKSYPRHRPSQIVEERPQQNPRRRPITESFLDATWHIGKKTESLKRLADDDRFVRNGQELAHQNLWDLKRARQRLDEVIAELEGWWDK